MEKKNIHVIPTDKPSRLFYNVGGGLLYTTYEHYNGVNLYITSNEEIKEGDWVIQVNFEKTNTQLIKCVTESQVIIANSKNGSFTKSKITLTTDQDLIKDGIQAIDDEFLEWFVNHPECEDVEVKQRFSDFTVNPFVGYKIITPTEEPKSLNMEKKTIEEAATNNWDAINGQFKDGLNPYAHKIGFISGAEWYAKNQSEQMYSEEDVVRLLEKFKADSKFHPDFNIINWFNLNKKS